MFGPKYKKTSPGDKKESHPIVSGKFRDSSLDKAEKVKGAKDYEKIRSLNRENPRMVQK